jgi:hypothetical protein
MCFVWISEQTAIISLHSINWLVFVTETVCVYCAALTESLNIRSAHTAYLCVLCGSQNKQRLIPCTTLTDWFYNCDGVCIKIIAKYLCVIQVFLPVLRFPLSVSFHQCSVLSLIYMLVLPGQTLKPRNLPKSSALSQSGERWIEKEFHLVFKGYLYESQNASPHARCETSKIHRTDTFCISEFRRCVASRKGRKQSRVGFLVAGPHSSVYSNNTKREWLLTKTGSCGCVTTQLSAVSMHAVSPAT